MHIPPIPAVESSDPEIAELINDEARRQYEKVRLIPSENYVSVAVLEASGSVLTNKYSEGYPGRRYYEGQQFIDPIETIARDRAKALFGVDHANVQPYSGSPANLAVYLAFAQPGDTIMGMALPMGGHLTHGWPVSVTGKWFRSVQYGVRHDTGRVDLDEVRDMALKEQPKIIFCTTENEFEKIQQAIINGADEYVMKPFDEAIIKGKMIQLGIIDDDGSQ